MILTEDAIDGNTADMPVNHSTFTVQQCGGGWTLFFAGSKSFGP